MNKLLYIVAAAALFTSTITLLQTQPTLNQVENHLSTNLLYEFNSWKINNYKTYESEYVEAYRMTIFADNWALINEHNNNANASYELGINQFMDLTKEEFAQTYLTLQAETQWSEEAEQGAVLPNGGYKAVNWVTAGMTSPIKN